MWNENCTDPRPVPEDCQETPELPLDFCRSLIPKPGCVETGECNECGLCEH